MPSEQTASAPSKRGPYARSARTKKRAIEAAIDLFGTVGFRGTTLTAVAERLGMTLTGLQYHFPDIDTLLTAVLEEYDEPPADAPRPEVLDDLMGAVETNARRPAFARLFTVLAAEAIDPAHPAHNYFVRRYRNQREAASRFFSRLVDQGVLAPGADTHSLAAQLIAASDGMQLQWLLDPGAIDLTEQMRRYLRAAIPALAKP